MEHETLQRLRDGIAQKKITLTRVSKLSGIPPTTLVEMKKPEYGKSVFERMERLKGALDELLPQSEVAA